MQIKIIITETKEKTLHTAKLFVTHSRLTHAQTNTISVDEATSRTVSCEFVQK
jgi:hypothetical protein